MSQSVFPSKPTKLLPRPPGIDFVPEGGGQSSGSRSLEALDYLFINKGQSSGNLSNCMADEEQTAINSHAQRFRHKPGHQGNDTKLRLVHHAPRSPSRYRFRTWTLFQGDTGADTKRTEQSWAANEQILGVESGLRCKSFKRNTVPVAEQKSKPVLYSNNFRPGDACDPFNTSAIPIDKLTYDMLQFFLHQGWKAHLRTVGKVDEAVWSRSFHDLSAIVRGCLSCEVHMYALLTCNALRIKCFGLDHAGELPNPAHLMSKTLKALRLRLANVSQAFPLDEQIILDIFFLAFSEFYRQDYAAMKTHVHMVRSIVDLFGGFEKVSNYIREACCYTEMCFAIETGEACVFDVTWKDWDPGPIDATRMVRVQAALASGRTKSFGAGFQKSLQDQFFDTETAKIVEDLMQDVVVLEFIRIDEEALPSDSWWACTRTRAIVRRLLSLAKQSEDQDPPMQELRVQCVTTTLIMYLCYDNSYLIPLRSLPFILSRLKRSLQLSYSNFSPDSTYSWGEHADMLLWIVITGFWMSGAGVSADAFWFLSAAIQGCRVLGLGSIKELQLLMGRFVWLEHLQTPSLMKLARYVLIVRDEAMEGESLTSTPLSNSSHQPPKSKSATSLLESSSEGIEKIRQSLISDHT